MHFDISLQNFIQFWLPEFAEELQKYGRIYMYRFRPDYTIKARSWEQYPHKSKQAACIMLMLQNNLDYAVAQHPHELITYGGNGAVFSKLGAIFNYYAIFGPI
jgi:urocanate hydratase